MQPGNRFASIQEPAATIFIQSDPGLPCIDDMSPNKTRVSRSLSAPHSVAVPNQAPPQLPHAPPESRVETQIYRLVGDLFLVLRVRSTESGCREAQSYEATTPNDTPIGPSLNHTLLSFLFAPFVLPNAAAAFFVYSEYSSLLYYH